MAAAAALPIKDEWGDQDAVKALSSLLSWWWTASGQDDDDPTVRLRPTPPHITHVVGRCGCGKRRVVTRAFDVFTATCLTEERPAFHWVDAATVLGREDICGPSSAVMPANDNTTTAVFYPRLRTLLNDAAEPLAHDPGTQQQSTSRKVVVWENMDSIFSASDTSSGGGGKASSDDEPDPQAWSSWPPLRLATGGSDLQSALCYLTHCVLTCDPTRTFFIFTSSSKSSPGLASGGGSAVTGAEDNNTGLCAALAALAQTTIRIRDPSEATRAAMAEHALRQCCSVDVPTTIPSTNDTASRLIAEAAREFASRTGGMSLSDLRRTLHRCAQRLERIPVMPQSKAAQTWWACSVGATLASAAGEAHGDPREAFLGEDPWDAVAGLTNAKQALQRAARWLDAVFCERAAAVSGGVAVPSAGVLLYGIPGTGKTLLARVMARASSSTFLVGDMTELVHAAVGESEEAVRRLFRLAREHAPTIVFLDEVQAVFGRRHDDTAHHEKRLLSCLLQELDASRRQRVLVVAATNIPWALDTALLRGGRIDVHVHVPPPPPTIALQIAERMLRRYWGWTGNSPDGDTNGQLMLDGLAARLGADADGASTSAGIYSGADVAAISNIIGLHTFALLRPAEEDGGGGHHTTTTTPPLWFSAFWNRRHTESDQDAALVHAALAEAFARVTPSTSLTDLKALEAWRPDAAL